MAPTKMPCKNNDKFMYTGKEMSPHGLGFCAEAENVSTTMVGRDGKRWIVGIKNHEKIWIRAPENIVLVKEDPILSEDDVATPTKAHDEEAPIPPAPKKGRKPSAPKTVKPTVAKELVLGEDEPVEKPKKVVRKKKTEETVEEPVEKPKKVVRKKKTEEAVEEPVEKPKKVVRKKKTDETVEEPVEKPKRVYKRKPKAEVDESVAVELPKKEKTKRGPSAWNLFMGAQLREMHKKHPGLERGKYMQMVQEMWSNMTKEEKDAIKNTQVEAVEA